MARETSKKTDEIILNACLTDSSLRTEFPFSAHRTQTSRHDEFTQNESVYVCVYLAFQRQRKRIFVEKIKREIYAPASCDTRHDTQIGNRKQKI